MHHRNKVDAPSGTALLLGEAAARGREIALSKHAVKSRDGHTGPRKDGDIGFATLRGGSVVGEHSVIFAGTGERITLSHPPRTVRSSAHGALTGGALGPWPEAWPLFHDGRPRAECLSPSHRPEAEEFFARLKKHTPTPETELNYVNPYTLLVAVVDVGPGHRQGREQGHGSAIRENHHARTDGGAGRGKAGRSDQDHRALSRQGEES